VSIYTPPPADGHAVRWERVDGAGDEEFSLRWENEAWTANGVVSHERIQYVVRISPSWQVRQFILFRDLDEPDLWLATDGSGRWGEMNGAHRPELDGCYDIHLACTPFTRSLAVHRLPLQVGHTADLPVVCIDVDTLDVRAEPHRYTRLDAHRWEVTAPGTGPVLVEVDGYGLPLSEDGRFRRG
jgi:hypothetical protein